MRRLIYAIGLIIGLSLIMVTSTGFQVKQKVTFRATVKEVYSVSIVVEPHEGSNELLSSDLIVVSVDPDKQLIDRETIHVGDIIEITYDGLILESYPAQIKNVYKLKIIKK